MKHSTTPYLKQFSLFAIIIGCVVSFDSCVSYKNTSRVGAVGGAKVAVINNVADVDVDFKNRITATSEKTWCEKEAKEQAYYRAIVKNNIDILVDPIYEVRTKGKRSVATVTGYAGMYKNVRTSKQENQAVFEQNLKNVQTANDQSMALLDKKLQELDKFAKVDAVAKEDLKTYLIIAGGYGTGGALEKTLNTNVSIVDKYNALSNGGSSAAPCAPMAAPTTLAASQESPSAIIKSEPMPKKKKK